VENIPKEYALNYIQCNTCENGYEIVVFGDQDDTKTKYTFTHTLGADVKDTNGATLIANGKVITYKVQKNECRTC